MINANQITSRLRMMSDQELQRFAEMHKQDPYMFPLAFNESNMRKEMRSAPQGQGAAPQAPVNQQALAAMHPAQLPEDQGIGALNPNMQFADGGLVAFAGGGESTAGPYAHADDRDFGTGGVAYADGGAIRFANLGVVPSIEDPTTANWQTAFLRLRDAQQKTALAGRDTSDIDAQLAELEKSRPESMRAKVALPETPMPPRVLRSPFESRETFGLPPAEYKALKASQATPPAAPAVAAAIPIPTVKTPPSIGGPLPSSFPMPSAESASNVPLPSMSGGLRAAQPSAGLGAIPRAPAGAAPVAADSDFVESTRKLFSDAAEAQAKRDAQREMEYLANRPESESFKERKAALEEDRADVEKESRMNEGLAWLTFASKVVQPGKNTIQAIVEGASAGGEQYSRAQKELKKAEKERKMGLASLAEAERAAKAGDFEKAQARRDAMATRSENSLNAQVAAVAAAYGITHKEAHDMLLAQMQITSQENIARERNETAIAVAKTEYGHKSELLQQRQLAAFDKTISDNWNDMTTRMSIQQKNPNIQSEADYRRFMYDTYGKNILGGETAQPKMPVFENVGKK